MGPNNPSTRSSTISIRTPGFMVPKLSWTSSSHPTQGGKRRAARSTPNRCTRGAKTNQTPEKVSAFAAIVIARFQPRSLLEGEQYSFDALRVADTTGKPLPNFLFIPPLTPPFSPPLRRKPSRNIVGLIEGRDPALEGVCRNRGALRSSRHE